MIQRIVTLVIVLPLCIQAAHIPDFKLKDLDNRRITFSEIKGERFTVLDFWATWCKPCVRAIPKLIELQENFSGRGVQVVGINVDSPRNTPKVKPFIRSLGVNYPVLLDMNSELSQQLQVTIMPTLFIADEEGKIVYIHQGYRPGDEQVIEAELESLLKTPENDEKK